MLWYYVGSHIFDSFFADLLKAKLFFPYFFSPNIFINGKHLKSCISDPIHWLQSQLEDNIKLFFENNNPLKVKKQKSQLQSTSAHVWHFSDKLWLSWRWLWMKTYSLHFWKLCHVNPSLKFIPKNCLIYRNILKRKLNEIKKN